MKKRESVKHQIKKLNIYSKLISAFFKEFSMLILFMLHFVLVFNCMFLFNLVIVEMLHIILLMFNREIF